jgi:MAGUK p55 subfamily protein 5
MIEAQASEEDIFLDRLSKYSEPNIKIVRVEKTHEPLGATVKNENESVIVGRIIRGGTAEASGSLHEGDEILEVNEVPMRGRTVNEVCDLLSQMQGTLTMLVVPARRVHEPTAEATAMPVMHIKARFDYDPEDDPYVPCKELGLSFVKGDILHVLNQKDGSWWQARREGEDDSQLPGLIPSIGFQEQREAFKQTIAEESEQLERGRTGTGLLCAKRSGHKKRRRTPFDSDPDGQAVDASAAEEVPVYEEVALYYPRSDRKRPVVLIGPNNIGRHELRQRLILDTDRFSSPIPRKFKDPLPHRFFSVSCGAT